MRFGEIRKLRHAAMAASEKTPPKRKFSWLRAPAVMRCCSATRRIFLRSAAGNLIEVCPRSFAWRCGGAPEMRASATSMPSTEVPDMSPSTNMGLGAIICEWIYTQRPRSTQTRMEIKSERTKRGREETLWGRGKPCPNWLDGLRDLFFQFGQKVEGIERLELV